MRMLSFIFLILSAPTTTADTDANASPPYLATTTTVVDPPAGAKCSVPASQTLQFSGFQRDMIQSVDDPTYTSAFDTVVPDTAEVIGLYFNSLPFAFPVSVLERHEIVNDLTNGFSVSYSPLTEYAIAFNSTQIKNSTIGVSGFLWENGQVFYDRLTQSLWLAANATGIRGSYICDQLQLIPVINTLLSTWTYLHPNTRVLTTDPLELTLIYGSYASSPKIAFPTSFSAFGPPGNQFDPKANCAVVQNHRGVFIYPYQLLGQVDVLNDLTSGVMLLSQLSLANPLSLVIGFPLESPVKAVYTAGGDDAFGYPTILDVTTGVGYTALGEALPADQTPSLDPLVAPPTETLSFGSLQNANTSSNLNQIAVGTMYWFAALAMFPGAKIMDLSTVVSYSTGGLPYYAILPPHSLDPQIAKMQVVDPGLTCCTPSPSHAGCYDDNITACVCKADPSCCLIAWDRGCVKRAVSRCSLTCPKVNDCQAAGYEQKGCSVEKVLECVCGLDPFCCTHTWDSICEARATSCSTSTVSSSNS